MAHYAVLDENNIVTEVIVGKDENDLDSLPEGFTSWEEFYSNKKGATVKRTSYNTHNNIHKLGNTPFRGTFAGIGYTYDEVNDVFIGPLQEYHSDINKVTIAKPFPSWIYSEETGYWISPVSEPEDADEIEYTWNEETQTWDLV